jgi:peptidoglycan/xylan/chitin deacetylase (PgdA/CDA1 family)
MAGLRARLGPRGRATARRWADLTLAPGLGSISGGSSTTAAAVTFDDGPDPLTTRAILRVLAAHGARATYFLLVSQAERHPDLVREIRDGGHEIGLHGFDHTPLTSYPHRGAVRMLKEARRRLEDVAQVHVRYYRPPYGKQTPSSWLAARRAGLQVVVWSADAADWEDLALEDHLAHAYVRFAAGGVLLLHERIEPGPDGSPVHARVDRAALTGAVLDELATRGLSAVAVGELVQDGTTRTAWFRR